VNLKKFYNKKKILITGHTGFKGSWLVHWLSRYNVKIMGIGLNPDKKLNLFKFLDKKKLIDKRFDITNLKKLEKSVLDFKPDIIYHLAAQSLVKKSIINPINTLNTNIIGTANILDCINKLNKKTISIIITSDKCYQNLSLLRGYREEDRLGGHDPYSASKASAEIIFKSYFDSILKKNNKIRIASARAGNVIGGGDWSQDRLVPDCVKAWASNRKVYIRNPKSTRPWQHVLEPLSGYIALSYNLQTKKKINGESFNFGPKFNEVATVKKVLKLSNKYWKNARFEIYKEKFFKEDHLLKLNSYKAWKTLKWKKVLSLEKTIELTMSWYNRFYQNKKKATNLLDNDINYYLKLKKSLFNE
jgi:CDP-glucose 4,6-dehydratase